jgi:hypothetical protein
MFNDSQTWSESKFHLQKYYRESISAIAYEKSRQTLNFKQRESLI